MVSCDGCQRDARQRGLILCAYLGMGNRFASMTGYRSLILGHGVIAVITFLFIVPAAIMVARFYGNTPGMGVRLHIYLQVMTVFLSTVVFVLGWFAVGPERSLTNPHHGIGVAIYTMILVQAVFGSWMRHRVRRRGQRRLSIKLMLHQWLGRAIALLGITQVALGLTLYGSPKFTFVLYTLWMTFLLVLYFILSYRAAGVLDSTLRYGTGNGGTVVQERRSSGGGMMQYLAPLAAGGLAAALFGGNKDREEREEVIASRRGSRRGSDSYIEEDKYEDRRKHGGGFLDTVLAVAGVVGAGALAKSYFDRKKERKGVDQYSAVDPDTPSRHRQDRHTRYEEESDLTGSSLTPPPRRVSSHRRQQGSILPGPGDPVATAAAMSAANSQPVTPRPVTPRPVGRPPGHARSRRDSYDSYSSTASPSRRTEQKDSHAVRNGLLGGLGLAWLGKKFKDRKDRKEQQRLDDIRAAEIEEQQRIDTERREGNRPTKFTADGRPHSSRHSHRDDMTESSLTTTDFTDSALEPSRRGTGPMPPLNAGILGGASGASVPLSRSRHDGIGETVPPPSSFSERATQSTHLQDSTSTGRGREEQAAAAAVASAAGLAAEEERRRRRERSQSRPGDLNSPPVSLKLTQHYDKKRNVTLRRLTEEEAAAERAARREQRGRADSASSLSASETAQNRRRYRRDESSRRSAVGSGLGDQSDAGLEPLSPPRPAYAAGRAAKDSSYYSGTPGRPAESVESPATHDTWSGMSPGSTRLTEEDPAERRRRRRAERQIQTDTTTVDFQ